MPIVVVPAEANADCESGPELVVHFHLDHVSSTQVVTGATGDIIHQIRYDAYGRVRGRFDAAGAPIGSNVNLRTEFGGYTNEPVSGLQHAGLRTYDPLSGQFLQLDPAGEFPSPFAFGPWDPINGRDPSGAAWEVGAILFAIALVLAVANAIYVGVTTGDAVAAFTALFAGVTLALISGGLVGPTIAAAAPAWAEYSISAASIGYGTYSTVDSARSGNVIGAVSSGINVVLAAYAVGASISSRTSQAVSGTDVADGDSLEFTFSEGDSAAYADAIHRLREGDPSLFNIDRTVEIETALDPHPAGEWAATDPSGTRVTIYPKARANIGDLTSTLGHELNHVRDVALGRVDPFNAAEMRASEIRALKWEVQHRSWTGGDASVRSATINLRRLELQARPPRAY